jgi:peptide deformylase
MDKMVENYKLEGEILPIHTFPDPVLKKVAQEVTEFNDELKELCKNMLYTMYYAPGIGLAAPQVGISKRIFVLDVDYDRDETSEGSGEYEYSNFNPMIFINPVFRDEDGEIIYQEGCLSLPGIYEDVKRFEHLVVDYQDTDGNKHSLEANELLAICIQHENDHLNGIVFIDKLSSLKRNMLRKKLIKEKQRKAQHL